MKDEDSDGSEKYTWFLNRSGDGTETSLTTYPRVLDTIGWPMTVVTTFDDMTHEEAIAARDSYLEWVR
jgi:hypothetical protein